MVETISLPIYPKGKCSHDWIYAISGSDCDGNSTPATVSSLSVYTQSPTSVKCRLDEVQSALTSLNEGYDMMGSESRLIGRGASGCVWSAVCRRSGAIVAVKTVSKPAYGSTWFPETTLLQRVQNVPGVVRHVESFADEDCEIIVMELCQGSDLQTLQVGELMLCQLKIIFRDLLMCIGEIHHRGISHGDIRLENVIAYFGTNQVSHTIRPCIKLIDFGSSISGTAEACVDYISAGKLLFELVIGYRASVAEILAYRELHARYENVFDLVKMLLNTTPTNFLQTGKYALNHAWLLD